METLEPLPAWAEIVDAVALFGGDHPYEFASHLGVNGDTVARLFTTAPSCFGYETARKILGRLYVPERDVEVQRLVRSLYASFNGDVEAVSKRLGWPLEQVSETLSAQVNGANDPRMTTLRSLLARMPAWNTLVGYAKTVSECYTAVALSTQMGYKYDSQLYALFQRKNPRFETADKLVDAVLAFPPPRQVPPADDVIKEAALMVKRLGLRPAARALGVNHGWLRRIIRGDIKRPYVWVLRRLADRLTKLNSHL